MIKEKRFTELLFKEVKEELVGYLLEGNTASFVDVMLDESSKIFAIFGEDENCDGCTIDLLNNVGVSLTSEQLNDLRSGINKERTYEGGVQVANKFVEQFGYSMHWKYFGARCYEYKGSEFNPDELAYPMILVKKDTEKEFWDLYEEFIGNYEANDLEYFDEEFDEEFE